MEEGMEEVRDGGLRLVGSTLRTPTVRLRSETHSNRIIIVTQLNQSAAPQPGLAHEKL